MTAVQFLLNGQPWSEDCASPTTTVLDWLRSRARLTGTKEGCAEGDCGACTIVLGRALAGALRYEAVNSCLMLLPQIDGCDVLTVEGLAAPDGSLHPVQQAMVDADATQCGFCTPGFVMAMFAFHHGGEQGDDDIVHEALAGNLCRCTGYRSIVDACRRIARGPADRFASDKPVRMRTLAPLLPCNEYRAAGQIFLRPRSLGELFSALADLPDALLLAGGTDLGLRASKGREAIPAIIALDAIVQLQRIAVSSHALELGGGVTYRQALPHLDRHFPSFAALVRRIGSRQIRNLGTIAGNLATASSIGDTIPCLIALGAAVTLASKTGERTVSVDSFITGYRQTALRPGEVIAAIHVPLLEPGVTFSAYKLSKRFDQDIATVIAAFFLRQRSGNVHELRAAYGGMAPRAMRAARVEQILEGQPWTMDALVDIERDLAREFTPLTDHRGGAAYRLRAAANLIRRFQMETSSGVLLRVEAL
jgi:xanthine dehydrogenase small subunit